MEIELILKDKDYFTEYFPEKGIDILTNLRKQIEIGLKENYFCHTYIESYDEHGDCLFQVISFYHHYLFLDPVTALG